MSGGHSASVSADGPRNQAVVFHAGEAVSPDCDLWTKCLVGRLVHNQLAGTNEALAAYLADQRVVGQLLQVGLKLLTESGRPLENTVSFMDFDHLDSQRGRDGMTAIGKAVAEHSPLLTSATA